MFLNFVRAIFASTGVYCVCGDLSCAAASTEVETSQQTKNCTGRRGCNNARDVFRNVASALCFVDEKYCAALCRIDEQLCYVKDDEPDAKSITLLSA